MIKRLNSNVFIPSGDTIYNDILNKFNIEKEYIKKEFHVYCIQIILLLTCKYLI